jgi:hypothetical protein
MDLLEKCRELLKELEETSVELEEVTVKLAEKDLDLEQYEQLYAKEFALSVRMSGAYDDLEKYTEELASKENMSFIANRYMQRAKEYVTVEVIG